MSFVIRINQGSEGRANDVRLFTVKAVDEDDALVKFLLCDQPTDVLGIIYSIMLRNGYAYIAKEQFPELLDKLREVNDLTDFEDDEVCREFIETNLLKLLEYIKVGASDDPIVIDKFAFDKLI